jgi:hypothetical protein
MNDIRGEFGLQRASSWKEAALAMDELFHCRWSQLSRLFFRIVLIFLVVGSLRASTLFWIGLDCFLFLEGNDG